MALTVGRRVCSCALVCESNAVAYLLHEANDFFTPRCCRLSVHSPVSLTCRASLPAKSTLTSVPCVLALGYPTAIVMHQMSSLFPRFTFRFRYPIGNGRRLDPRRRCTCTRWLPARASVARAAATGTHSGAGDRNPSNYCYCYFTSRTTAPAPAGATPVSLAPRRCFLRHPARPGH